MSDEEEQQYTDEEEEYEAEQIDTTTTTAKQQQKQVEEEEEEEEEEEGHAAPPVKTVSPVLQQALEAKEETKKELRRAPPPKPKEPGTQEMSEAEQKMLEVKKRHEEEEEAKMRDNDERRRQELHQVEAELQQLRERQVQRKAEREQEEAELAARRRKDEERRRKQEEERKARLEEEKWRRDEERRKRQRMLGGLGAGGDEGAEGGFKPKQTAKAKKGMTAEEQANAKRNYIASINRLADVANMLPNDIKIKIKQLYARIVKLEGDKYDLEKRKQRQEYDVKELADRQKQQARHKAIDEGVDPTELENSNHPPKVRVASKFDRQTDRRDYGARRELFENPLVKPELSIVHGSGRPPLNWGRKELEELEQLRKNLEPPKYIEEIKAEGGAARPPVPVIPLQLPPDADVPAAGAGEKQMNGSASGRGASDNWRERAAHKEKQLPAPPPKDTKKKVRV